MLIDLCKVFIGTTGTGTITLGAAVPAFCGTEALMDGIVYGYAIQQDSNYEYGRGTYVAASKQLTRSPIKSSNGGAAINIQPGAAVAFPLLAEDIAAIIAGSANIIDSLGTSHTAAPSQNAVKVAFDAVATALYSIVADALGTSATIAPSQRAVKAALDGLTATVAANGLAQRAPSFPAVPIQSILSNNPVDLRELKLSSDSDWSNALDKATAFGPVSIIVPASASGLPISRPFTQNAGGNQLIGLEGAGNCFFAIDPTFVAGGAAGVMNIPSSASERGAGCDGVGFSFSQPASRTRSNLFQYPYAINANGCTRPLFGNVRISGATNGMMLQGCGGMNANVLEIGCYGMGISLGNALDWVHINKFHFWPFGIAGRSDLFAIYNDINTIAWRSQRIDGLQVDNFDCLSGQIIFEADGSANGGFLRIGNMCLDSDNARVDITSSRVDIGNLYTTGTSADIYKLAHHGNGQSFLSVGFLRGTSASTTNPIVIHDGTGTTMINNGYCELIAPNQSFIRQSQGVVSVNNLVFGPYINNQVRTVGAIYCAAGRMTATGIRASDVGSGSGKIVQVDTDGFHLIGPIVAPGWPAFVKPTGAQGIYPV